MERIDMERNPLIDLAEDLERRKRSSLDLIVDSRSLRAVADEGEMKLEVPGYPSWPLTEWAHGQLADKTEIPRRYYERMRETGKTGLLAENVNAWVGEKERRLIRITDNRIRAILSDRYRIMDNYDLLFAALEEFKRKETVRIHEARLTDTNMYVKAIDTALTAEIRDEDVIYGGLIIRNSEVGASSFKVEPFLLRKICSNGLIAEYALKKIHLSRQTSEVGEIDWSDAVRELEDKALRAKVEEIIRKTFERDVFESWVDKLRRSAEAVIEKPVIAVNNVAKMAGLSEEQKNELLLRFAEHTGYGLINAVTSLARDTENIDEQVRLEEIGGKLLQSPENIEESIKEVEIWTKK